MRQVPINKLANKPALRTGPTMLERMRKRHAAILDARTAAHAPKPDDPKAVMKAVHQRGAVRVPRGQNPLEQLDKAHRTPQVPAIPEELAKAGVKPTDSVALANMKLALARPVARGDRGLRPGSDIRK